jgi:cell division protein FtsB
MRWLTLLLVALIVSLQYPLWLGKGSWLRVWDLSRQIDQQVEANAGLKARNDGLDAEVRDLKAGYTAIEERARSELGMVKQDELFYQVMEGAVPSELPASVVTPVLPNESQASDRTTPGPAVAEPKSEPALPPH